MEATSIAEDMLNNNPLVIFSIYVDSQSRIIRELGVEILARLDTGISPNVETGKGAVLSIDISCCYGRIWLWVIGAYEIVRTMCQAKQCFSQRVVQELHGLKHRLGFLRMPFAKQELRGKSVPVHAENSIAGIGSHRRTSNS
ncbi:hypothetical protein GobsT_16860 [Gemmata obscuriglobus]|uniref:hypothetical protein n=1 Tax=Gemmata obscuriglobus TaxID=114 RepID=UPI0011CD05AF|nr:hypothetical protein [Gemmata obscuriglobus]QEG26938.1 hypothetical protein GobsT_16860 [Gemmata obscuriglobus]VTS03104.1 Hypothethical protein OS=Ralstonia solanacearum CMR15 GN=CMR15_mp10914 PE=4 SV=1 [Gemmata obscuriglobus UQM 2246]